MDDLSFGGKFIQLAGDAIIKPSSHCNQQIAIGDGKIGVGGTMHPQHANGQGVTLIKCPLTHQGGGDGNLKMFGEPFDFFVGPGGDRPTPHIHQRLTAVLNQRQSLANLPVTALHRGFIAR